MWVGPIRASVFAAAQLVIFLKGMVLESGTIIGFVWGSARRKDYRVGMTRARRGAKTPAN